MRKEPLDAAVAAFDVELPSPGLSKRARELIHSRVINAQPEEISPGLVPSLIDIARANHKLRISLAATPHGRSALWELLPNEDPSLQTLLAIALFQADGASDVSRDPPDWRAFAAELVWSAYDREEFTEVCTSCAVEAAPALFQERLIQRIESKVLKDDFSPQDVFTLSRMDVNGLQRLAAMAPTWTGGARARALIAVADRISYRLEPWTLQQHAWAREFLRTHYGATSTQFLRGFLAHIDGATADELDFALDAAMAQPLQNCEPCIELIATLTTQHAPARRVVADRFEGGKTDHVTFWFLRSLPVSAGTWGRSYLERWLSRASSVPQDKTQIARDMVSERLAGRTLEREDDPPATRGIIDWGVCGNGWKEAALQADMAAFNLPPRVSPGNLSSITITLVEEGDGYDDGEEFGEGEQYDTNEDDADDVDEYADVLE
jgi:hypothetical protein